MRFAVLGPVRASGPAGEPIPVAAKQRLLLAVLLSRAGDWMSVDAIVDALWGDDAPTEPRKRLSWHVHRLRRRLGDTELIVWRDGYYIMDVSDETFDARRFESLWRRADRSRDDPARAGRLLTEALALWRGPAFGDLGDHHALRPEVVRLHELRAQALEIDMEAKLASDHRGLVAELSTLVDEFPLRERFRAQLMLALYRAGRQPEALRVYDEARRFRVDSLGIEPGEELRRLHKDILRDDVDVTLPSSGRSAVALTCPKPAELPGDVATFVGRRDQLAQLTRPIVDARTAPGAIAIAGAGGVGKSTLAVQVAHRIAHRFPDGQIYVNLHGTTPDVEPLSTGEVLSRFLRSLGVSPLSASPDLDELASRFRSAANGKRLLFVLDDARDADQVRRLLPGGNTCAVVVTSRRSLASLDGFTHHNLDVLPDDDATELLSRLVGARRVADEPEATARVGELCGRMPLALCIAAAYLKKRPQWTITSFADRLADERTRLHALQDADRAVHISFMASYQALANDSDGESVAHMFRLMGLHNGPDITSSVAAAAAGVSRVEAERRLDKLVDFNLVDNPAPGRYRCHDLLRLFAREQAAVHDAPDDRHATLQRIYRWYLATTRNALVTCLPELRNTDRVMIASTGFEPEGIPFDDARDAHAWASAEFDNLIAAVRQSVTMTGQALRTGIALAVTVAPFRRVHGRFDEHFDIAELAAQAAATTVDPASRFLTRMDLAELRQLTGDTSTAMTELETALTIGRTSGNAHWEAVALYQLGTVHLEFGDNDRAIELLREGTAMCRALGDEAKESAALVDLGVAYDHVGRVDDALAALQRSADIARQAGHPFNEAAALGNYADVLNDSGRPEAAAARFREVLTLDREHSLTDTVIEADHLWGLAEALFALDDLAGARRHWNLAAEILHRLGVLTFDEKHAIEMSRRPVRPIPVT